MTTTVHNNRYTGTRVCNKRCFNIYLVIFDLSLTLSLISILQVLVQPTKSSDQRIPFGGDTWQYTQQPRKARD